MMKKIFLFLSFVFFSGAVLAQTGGDGNTNGTQSGGDLNGQAPPSYQNPYGNQPFQNPFGTGNNNNQNIFNKQNNSNDPNSNNNQNNTNTGGKDDKKNTTQNPTDNNNQNNNLDLRDKNTNKELEELYKNDPDYLKYLGKEDKDKDKDKADLKDDPYKEDPGGSNVYGSGFLNNNAFNSSDKRPTTVPDDYRLGVGDEIVVSIWGNSEFQNPYTISRDGSIFPSRVGKIYLQGLSFEAARNVVRSRFRKIVAQGSNIDIVMGRVRTIRVNVVGEVKRPGTVTMSAFNTPLNAISLSGGLTKNGNLRDIQVIRNGVVVERLDVYRFMQNGNFGKEIYLEDNDYISVRLYDKVVKAQGLFKRPMFYQMTEYETLDDLIKLAGGPTFNARESLIRVKTIENEQEKYIDFNGKDYFSNDNPVMFVLRDGDVVIIKGINEGLTNTVTIKGSIKYPEVYQLKSEMRLFDVIKMAGGVTNTAYKSRAYVYRKGRTADKNEAIKVELTDLENYNNPENIVIESGDIINVLSERIFNTRYSIQVIGLVKNPGKQIYYPNLKLKDVLLMAGGLALEAESGRIEISNVTDTITKYGIYGTPTNLKIVSISPNLEIDEVSENITIKPYDKIYIRKKKELIQQESVYIVGEVDYPGEHTLLGKRERLTTLIKRTGGLTASAFPDGAKLYRTNVGPVVIDLNEAMKRSGGKHDLILENGDRIIIPTKNDIVSIRGNVQNQINIKFNKEQTSVMNYIDAAGGFGNRPWRKRITVKYQNGRLKSTKNFLFFKFYPKVKPGCTIKVPVRPDGPNIDFKDVFQYGISTATSVLTILLLTRSLE